MANGEIKNLTFTKKQMPRVIALANKLAKADKRSLHDKPNAHNSIRLLVLEAGNAKLKHPQLYRQFLTKIQKIETSAQSACAD